MAVHPAQSQPEDHSTLSPQVRRVSCSLIRERSRLHTRGKARILRGPRFNAPELFTQALIEPERQTFDTQLLAPLPPLEPQVLEEARVSPENTLAPVKARVAAPVHARTKRYLPDTVMLTRVLPAARIAKYVSQTPKSKSQNHRKPIFLLGRTQKRRARGHAARGGYYAFTSTPKPQIMPRPMTWFLGITGAFVTIFVGLFLLAGLGISGAYWFFTKDLPSVDNLSDIKFETTRIYDRYGNLLYEMYDPNQGKRTYVTIDQIPKTLINATISTEDKSFEKNTGIDPEGIMRALYTDFTKQSQSGASTITQQLVRRVLLPEKDEPTLTRKIREALLAIRVTDKYSKDKILEIYLNEIYYGSQSYGVAAAADTFWGKKVKDLTLGQSAMLAGLPQTPSQYDPNVNFDLAKARQRVVLDLMVENKYVTKEQADAAFAEDVHPIPRTANVPRAAPHFVNYVRQVLEDKYGVQLANRGGLKVFTTIDLSYQAEAQKIAAAQIDNIKRQNASNAAVVALNARTGEILAMVGSVDYTDPQFGEYNVATSLRQPGSSFKPITYATGFEAGGFSPVSIIPDLPVKFADGSSLPYIPQNYDGRFHGPVTIRAALANSYNIPAVEMLQTMGVPNVLDMAHKMGITTLNDPERYGLSLTLGGGEVTLLDMTSAYATLANYGYHTPATPFLKVVDADGKILEELDRSHPAGNRALDQGTAYQISDILSDNAARTPAFGPNSALKIDGINAAAKTGTTNDWKDSWTMGYTPALAVGVWVGNNNGKPMAHVAGAIGAAPIWSNFIKKVYSDPEMKSVLLKPTEEELPDRFARPPDMIAAEICNISGMAAGAACTDTHTEYFTEANLPQAECDWHRWVTVTLHDGGASVAGAGVPRSDTIQRIYTTAPAQYRSWVGGGPPSHVEVITDTLGTGPQAIPLPTPVLVEPLPIPEIVTPVPLTGNQTVPPVQNIGADTLTPILGLVLEITAPLNDATVRGLVTITGRAQADDFAHYKLEFGAGDGSSGMTPLADSIVPTSGDTLGVWNTDGLAPGPYLLRLTMDTNGGQTVKTETVVRIVAGPPSVTITSPVNGSLVFMSEATDINITPDGAGAAIAGVEIYVDGRRIVSLTSPPWTMKWAAGPGTHDIDAIAYTATGESARATPVQVTVSGVRPTATPTRAPILWISRPTLYQDMTAGVNEVWVDIDAGSRVQHVDIYIDGLPGGYATGPGFRVNPSWTPTPVPPGTVYPTATLNTDQAATSTQVAATAQVEQTRVARAQATRTAKAQATQRIIAANGTATAVSGQATALVVAATTSPTPTGSPTASPTATFVVYDPLPDPMLGDFVARCQFNKGRHRVTAIGYDQNNIEVSRDETWVVVK